MHRESLSSEKAAVEPTGGATDQPPEAYTSRRWRNKRYGLLGGVVCLFGLCVWSLAVSLTRPLNMASSSFDAHRVPSGQASVQVTSNDTSDISRTPNPFPLTSEC